MISVYFKWLKKNWTLHISCYKKEFANVPIIFHKRCKSIVLLNETEVGISLSGDRLLSKDFIALLLRKK